MFKIRNVIEAGILAVAAGVPVLSIYISLTAPKRTKKQSKTNPCYQRLSALSANDLPARK